MEQQIPGPEQRWSDRLYVLQEVLFCLNLVCGLAYGLVAFTIIDTLFSSRPRTDFGYYLLRAVVRTEDLLRLSSVNAVTTDAVRRQSNSHWTGIGVELTVLVTVLGTVAILLVVMRLIPEKVSRLLSGRVSVFLALFVVPASYVFIKCLRPDSSNYLVGSVPPQFVQRAAVSILIANILGATLVLIISKRRRVSSSVQCVLASGHCIVWGFVLSDFLPVRVTHELFVLWILLGLIPLSLITWAKIQRRLVASADQGISHRLPSWIAFCGAVGLAAVFAIWRPDVSHKLTEVNEMEKATIELSRGPCYGACPSYRLLIHGNGFVEYVGYTHVKITERQTTRIGQEKVAAIFRRLRAVNFDTLEDRAFTWCFDTPSVGVSVTTQGRTKWVTSDASCLGSDSGRQAQFVSVANEIDSIVGSDRWVSCGVQRRCY